MLEQLAKAGAVLFSIAGIAYLAGLAVAYCVERLTLRRLKAEGVEERIQRVLKLISRFQHRRDQMLPMLVRLDDQVKSARRRHYMVNKRLADLAVSRSRLLRVLGEEEAFARAERPARRFIAHVINRHVQRAHLEQKAHPFLAPSWGRAQQVHAWASSIGDAKVLIERVYPPSAGFAVIDISEPDGEAALADPAANLQPESEPPAAGFRAAGR
ncbi:hypothetical protein [Rhodocista pekingensis]|uniref:LemA family protein n=1 Tax=Rhodocista pekingensis TaxID=201185 RepID=A0ABW2KTP6_9PROT